MSEMRPGEEQMQVGTEMRETRGSLGRTLKEDRVQTRLRSLMVVGTASNVGKSILCTALCRIFHQDKISVAPFKAQNMSLNSAVTPSGCEIGRAQSAQAEAAGILPNEHMNPVLLKPTGDMRTQVVLQGRVYDTVSARSYFSSEKDLLWQAVVDSYQFLAERYDLIVMEGAGSPVEMNLKPRDIANLRAAEMADAVVVLVADIDRGGVFASVVGTLQLLTPEERQRVQGIIINRFRGDLNLFADGVKLLEDYTAIPVLGVIPYLPDIGIDEEDSVALESERYQPASRATSDSSSAKEESLQIAVIRLPHISNFTDFDPLFAEPGVDAYFASKVSDLAEADAIVLPGTKSTMSDLVWLSETGFTDAIRQAQREGRVILGICGGYQMLGARVFDPFHEEHEFHTECDGVGLFSYETTIAKDKQTVLVAGELHGPYAGIAVRGYEIHMGQTTGVGTNQTFASTHCALDGADRSAGTTVKDEGVVSDDGRVLGTYLHGILHNDEFRTAWLNQIREVKGLVPQRIQVSVMSARESAYDRLAETVRRNLNLPLLYKWLQPS